MLLDIGDEMQRRRHLLQCAGRNGNNRYHTISNEDREDHFQAMLATVGFVDALQLLSTLSSCSFQQTGFRCRSKINPFFQTSPLVKKKLQEPECKILDLRYNKIGSWSTSPLFGSMLRGVYFQVLIPWSVFRYTSTM